MLLLLKSVDKVYKSKTLIYIYVIQPYFISLYIAMTGTGGSKIYKNKYKNQNIGGWLAINKA